MRVWDPLVRIFHWSLVSSFALAWFTSTWRESIHYWAGYAAASLVLVRFLWGFLGTPYARFSQFIQNPKTVLRYLLAMLKGTEARHIGHNPAGGAMVLALMAASLMTAFTGWMMTTDAYFGEDWVQILHSLCADGVVALIALHLAGVVLASLRHRENLVRAMITGLKRRAEPGDFT